MKTQGFSIIELLIGVILLGVAALAAFALQDTALRATREARITRLATDLSRANIERLRSTITQTTISNANCGLPTDQDGYSVSCAATYCSTVSNTGACTSSGALSTARAVGVKLVITRSNKTYVDINTLIYRP
jgi:prepilin-type N-terminal cleavage/methylation domain-containing protein